MVIVAIDFVAVWVTFIALGAGMDRFYGDTDRFFLIAFTTAGLFAALLSAAIVASS